MLPQNLEALHIRHHAILYVISSGADRILLSSGVSGLKAEVGKFETAPRNKGLVYHDRKIVQASQHFVYDKGPKKTLSSSYLLSKWKTPCIRKVWRPENIGYTPQMIDYRAPPVLVPSKIFAAEMLVDSLFYRNAFWALAPLFTTSLDHGCVWSLWIQRLLWEYDGHVEFISPIKAVNSKNININFTSQMSNLTQLGDNLSAWRCDVSNTFYACVNDLAQRMVGWKYFNQKEISVIKIWLTLMESVQPIRINNVHNDIDGKRLDGHRVVFYPGRTGPYRENQIPDLRGRISTDNPFSQICKHYSKPFSTGSRVNHSTKAVIDDILLIIIFNRPGHLGNLDKLYYIHGRYFSHIVVCSHTKEEFQKSSSTKNTISFIEISLGVGIFGYRCMMEAMQMGYDVRGYLQIGDDVLLNSWNIAALPRNRTWFQKRMRVGKLSSGNVPGIDNKTFWWPWSSQYGVVQLKLVWKTFAALLKDSKIAPKIQQFLTTLHQNTKTADSAFYEASDIYYVPANLKNDYLFFSSIFLSHYVYLEIAIPTILNGLSPNKKIVRIPGNYLWDVNRARFRETFKQKDCFLHPFKLMQRLRQPSGVTFFCNDYLPLIEGRQI